MTPAMKARKNLGLTIYQVADLAAVSAATVSRVERAKQDSSKDTAENLAKALGISEEQILYPERFKE